LSACPVVSVMLVAACTVTVVPWALLCSWMPCCIAWKNGLSRPLITAAILPPEVPPPPPPPPPAFELVPLLQAASPSASTATAPAVPIRRQILPSIAILLPPEALA
jgi:hypothetical protein